MKMKKNHSVNITITDHCFEHIVMDDEQHSVTNKLTTNISEHIL